MEMALEQQKATARARAESSAPVRDETFTPDELAQILREANTRQSSPSVATIDQALETARELGIDEAHVLEAARALREKKIRREELAKRSRSHFMKLVRYLGSMVLVVTIVGIAAGIPFAKLVAMGMGIGAIGVAAQWIRAMFDARFPPEK